MITGKDLENRGSETLKTGKMKPNGDAALNLADRIAAARLLEPDAKDLHCRDCWTRGRDAAIRIFEAAG
jgi:hypothetical protein